MKRSYALSVLSTLCLAVAYAQPQAPRPKLSPHLSMLASGDPAQEEAARRILLIKPAGPQRPQPTVGAFVKFRGDANTLRAQFALYGAAIHTVVGDVATAEIPVRALAQVAALPAVIDIEEARQAKRSTDVSVPATGANQIWYGAGGPVAVGATRAPMPPPWSGNTGQNVLVGVVDSGLDLTHKDFLDSSGNTRVVSLWDQSAAKGTPPASIAGYPGFTGNECSAAQINAIRQKTEIVTSNPFSSGTMSFALGFGSGSTSTLSFTKGHNAASVVLADFDLDGNIDMLTGNLDGTLTWIQNKGGYSFVAQNPITVDTTSQVDAVATGDFNLDGFPDVVAVLPSNRVAILLGKGDGTFKPPSFIAVGNQPLSVAVGDMNGDGPVDLVVGNFIDGTVTVLLGDGKGNFAPAAGSPVAVSSAGYNSNTQFGATPSYIVIADLNGDGKNDLAVADFGRAGAGSPGADVSILLGNGDGTFGPPTSINTNYFARGLAVGDLNRDGIPDLAVVSYSVNITVLLGKGDGTFANPVNYPAGGTVGLYDGQSNILLNDFDGDGILDIAALIRSNTPNGQFYDKVSFLKGNGDGTFGTAQPVTLDSGGNASWLANANFHSTVCPEVDVDGHGTNVTGIAAGNGSAGGPGALQTPYRFMGMAPEAKIIFVKSAFTNQDIVDGVAYIEQKAAQMGLPVVINLSLGTQLGPHDGTSNFDTLTSGLAGPGQIVVAAMGNNGGDPLHVDGILEDGGKLIFDFTVPAGQLTPFELDGWYSGQDQLGITVTGPGGSCQTNPIYPGGATGVILPNAANCGNVVVTAYPTNTNNTDHEIDVLFSNGANPVPAGNWSVTLTGKGCGTSPCVTNGAVDFWMAQGCGANNACTAFTSVDASDTIIQPASGANVIAVASYVTANSWVSRNSVGGAPVPEPTPGTLGDVSWFSAQGPLRRCSNDAACLAQVQKPDITAPGEEIMGSYAAGAPTNVCGYSDGGCLAPDAQHVIYQGTSQATPHVTGAIALLLNQYGNMTPCQVKSSLTTSRTDNFTGQGATQIPNPIWGFGKLAVDLAIKVQPINAVVPNVVGLSLANAKAALAAVKLSAGAINYASSSTIPIGNVISQTPTSGSWCGAVNLVVAGIAVPDVTNKTQPAASSTIAAANLTVGVAVALPSANIPVGEALFTAPPKGTFVAPGSTVNIFISGVTVPTVAGQSKAAAIASLTGAGLTVGAITLAHSQTVTPGNIISQDPDGGAVVLPGTAVNLVLSAVLIPDITNQALNTGEAVVAAVNLTVGNVTPASNGAVTPGNIISINPAAGTLVEAGTSIDILVSGITVPDQTGQQQSVAASTISAAGLTVGNVTQAASAVVLSGAVMSENPGGGTIVLPGVPVDLVVSTGIGQLVVPDLTGYTQANATKALQSVGLNVGAITTAASFTISAGSVVSESPAPGSPAASGAAVNLVVSTGSSLQTLIVAPANPTIVPGMLLQFKATGTLNGTPNQNVTSQATWSSGTTVTATISSGGLVTGKAIGTSSIGARFGSTNVSTLLTVTAPGKCDTNRDSIYGPTDVQTAIAQALGLSAAVDLNGDGVVNAADVQIATNAALAMGCSAH